MLNWISDIDSAPLDTSLLIRSDNAFEVAYRTINRNGYKVWQIHDEEIRAPEAYAIINEGI